MAKRFKKDPFIGTSKIGEIRTTTTQLVKALGYPTFCNDDIPGGFQRPILYEWRIRTGLGPITIYDFKEWDDPDFAEDKVITWHVGGRREKYAARPVHPLNQWLSKIVGVAVVDTRGMS